MTEPSATAPHRTRWAVLKVLYLLTVTVMVFAVPAIEATRPARWVVVPLLLTIQLVVLVWWGVRGRELLQPLNRLKWLFAVLLVCYAFLPGDDRRVAADWYALKLLGRVVWINLGGLALAGLMCLQILTVLLASAVVRSTGPGTDLVVGLRALGLPKLFVYPLDLVLAKLGGVRRPGGGGGGGGGAGGGRRRADSEASTPGFFAVLRRLIRGDVAAFTTAIRAALQEARLQVEEDAGEPLAPEFAHDVAVIAGIGLVMVGFKMLKLLPGVPFASGHKTLLLFPLYLLAARLTHTRWGGTAAGSVMGVVGFLQGDGRFGILEVLKHLAPGLLIDLLMPIARRLPQRAWVYVGIGLLAGVARLTTELAVLVLLGTRGEVYLFFAAKCLPTLVAGMLSGFVAVAVLRAFPRDRLPGCPEEPPQLPPAPVALSAEKENG